MNGEQWLSKKATALRQGMIPLYATTLRIAKETRNGEQVHREYIFQHSGFKRYKYWNEV